MSNLGSCFCRSHNKDDQPSNVLCVLTGFSLHIRAECYLLVIVINHKHKAGENWSTLVHVVELLTNAVNFEDTLKISAQCIMALQNAFKLCFALALDKTLDSHYGIILGAKG